MSKPHDISQAIWDAALEVVFEIGESEEHDTLPIALALSQAHSRGLEDAANYCDKITSNDGVAIYTARKLASEIRALGSK